jgi:hypothetical protein
MLSPGVPHRGDLIYSDFATANGDPLKLPQIERENYLKGADALDNGSYWVKESGVTINDDGDGYFTITKTASTNKKVTQTLTNWFPPSAGTCSLFFYAKAGTLDKMRANFGVDGSTSIIEVEKVSGDGTATIVSGRINLTGLTSSGGLFRATISAKGWASAIVVQYYPDQAGSTAGSVKIGFPQVVLGDQPKPRPIGAGLDDWMGAFKPHNRLFGDGLGRYSVVDGSVNAEILLNPGFETAGGGGADIWADHQENAGDGALANETGIKHGGSDSAKMTTGASANTYTNMSRVTTPGAPYTVRGWNYGDGTNAGRYAVWDDDNAGWIIDKTSSGQTAAAWGEVVDHFTAPAGCESVTVYWYGPSANGGVCYWDDVSLRAQNTSGLVSCGECSDILLAAINSATFDCPANCRITGSFTVEDGARIRIRFRYTNATNNVYLEISNTGVPELRKIVGGAVTKVDNGSALTVGGYYRYTIEANGSAVAVFIDDESVASGTITEHATATGGFLYETMTPGTVDITTETFPQRSVGIIKAGGLAAPAYGIPGTWITQPDGSAFDVGESDAVMFTVKTFVASKYAYFGMDTGTAGSVDLPALRLISDALKVDPSGGDQTPQAWTAGTTLTFMQLLRSDTHGSQFLLHESGKQWTRFNVNEDVIPAAAAYPAISNYNAALYVTDFVLMNLSAVHSAEWVDVLAADAGDVAHGVVIDLGANQVGGFHLQFTITRPNPIESINFVRGRLLDNSNAFYVGAGAGDEVLRVYDYGTASQLYGGAGVLAAGASYLIDFIVDGDGVYSLFVDKVLKSSEALSAVARTVGEFITDSPDGETQEDLTVHPYPALGGDLGATDRQVAPQASDTGTADSDCLAILRATQVPAAGNLQVELRKAGSDELTYDVDSNGKPILYDNANADITGENGDVSSDDDNMIVLDGADGEIFTNGATDGSSASIAHLSGTTWNIASLGTAGAADALELWKLKTNMPFKL